MGIVLLVAIKWGKLPQPSWNLFVFFAGLYLVTALVAVEVGERDEETVESSVEASVLELHEEEGERVPWVAVVILIATLLPVLSRARPKYQYKLQVFAIVLSALGIAPLLQAGHSGGELVYTYGAGATSGKNPYGIDMDAEEDVEDSDSEPEVEEDDSSVEP